MLPFAPQKSKKGRNLSILPIRSCSQGRRQTCPPGFALLPGGVGGPLSPPPAPLRRGQVACDRVLVHVKHHDFIGRSASRFPSRKIAPALRPSGPSFSMDLSSARTVIVYFDFLESVLFSAIAHRANMLRRLSALDGEFEIVAVAALLSGLPRSSWLARDQAAHHAHVTSGAIQLALRFIQIVPHAR